MEKSTTKIRCTRMSAASLISLIQKIRILWIKWFCDCKCVIT